MKEVDFENEGNSEGIIGNDEDEEENGDVLIPALGLQPADGGDRDRGDDHLRLFEGMVQAVRVGAGAHWDDSVSVGALASLKASMRTSRRSKGESSSGSASASASAAAASEDCDHDSHHKRAKVHSDFQ